MRRTSEAVMSTYGAPGALLEPLRRASAAGAIGAPGLLPAQPICRAVAAR